MKLLSNFYSPWCLNLFCHFRIITFVLKTILFCLINHEHKLFLMHSVNSLLVIARQAAYLQKCTSLPGLPGPTTNQVPAPPLLAWTGQSFAQLRNRPILHYFLHVQTGSGAYCGLGSYKACAARPESWASQT